MLARLQMVTISVVMAVAMVLGSACKDEAPPTRAPGAPDSAPSIREIAEGGTTSVPSMTPGERDTPVAEDGTPAQGGANFSPLHRVNSFNYTVDFEFSSDGLRGGDFSGSMNMDGSYVAPDRFSASMSFDFPPMAGGPASIPDMDMVGIGSDFYMRFGGDWQKDDLAALGLESLSPAQEEFYDSFALKSLADVPYEHEDKNGVIARHYVLGTTDIGRLMAARGSGLDAYFTLKAMQDAKMDLWLAEDGGYSVAMVFEATLNPAELAGAFGQQAKEGADFDMNMRMTYELSDFNDPDITVDAPEI